MKRLGSKKVSYDKFNCWWPEDICLNEKLDISKVQKIDFVISNKPGDESGDGKIIIEKYPLKQCVYVYIIYMIYLDVFGDTSTFLENTMSQTERYEGLLIPWANYNLSGDK